MPEKQTVELFPGWSLTIDSHGEWVDSGGRDYDPSWQDVDSAGHGHFRTERGFPTLEWVSVPCSMGHGDDCISEGDWRCKICDEVLKPRSRQAKPQWVAGPTGYTLTVSSSYGVETYVFGRKDWETLLTALNDTARSTLADCLDTVTLLQS